MSKKTLFLDRDGVINRHLLGSYVTCIDEFEFLPGVFEAMQRLSAKFDYIFLITNQQGIGKGVFSTNDLEKIHQFMMKNIAKNGGRIDKIYFCPDLEQENSLYRKPNPGMGLQAITEFPDIDLEKSIMVGDSLLDMQFGKNLGIQTVYISKKAPVSSEIDALADFIFDDLLDFSIQYLKDSSL